jgi:hypothetical protein
VMPVGCGTARSIYTGRRWGRTMDVRVIAAIIAAGVALIVALIANSVATLIARRQALQAQFAEIVKRRAEAYPDLWQIHIKYETHWTDEGLPKTREWASGYLKELNEFNLKGGIFFSEALYNKFKDLHDKLQHVVNDTQVGELVDAESTSQIRLVVYGSDEFGPGLSTFEKDDLGSYRAASLQRRK